MTNMSADWFGAFCVAMAMVSFGFTLINLKLYTEIMKERSQRDRRESQEK